MPHKHESKYETRSPLHARTLALPSLSSQRATAQQCKQVPSCFNRGSPFTLALLSFMRIPVPLTHTTTCTQARALNSLLASSPLAGARAARLEGAPHTSRQSGVRVRKR